MYKYPDFLLCWRDDFKTEYKNSYFAPTPDTVSVDSVLPGMSVNIVTPNYPDYYPSSSNVEWKLRVSDFDHKTLMVTFNTFRVRTNPSCYLKYLMCHHIAL